MGGRSDAGGRVNRDSIVKASLLVLVLAVLFIAITWRVAGLTSSSFGDSAKVVQALGTVVAIFSGGFFAYYKLQMFRDFEPHLTISHRVSHRPVGDSYVHIDVTAILHNSSKVQIEIRKGFFLLQQISPVSDESVESMYAQVFQDSTHDNLQWPTLDEITRAWSEAELIVEPGESHQEAYEFIVTTDVESVVVYTYFHNSRHSQHSQTVQGWHATTIYDMM